MATRRSPVKPSTPANKAMSIRHLKESVRFNEAHRDEHHKAAVDDKKKLAAMTKQTKKVAKAEVKKAKR